MAAFVKSCGRDATKRRQWAALGSVWRTAPEGSFEHGSAFAVAFDAVVETCGLDMGKIASPHAAIAALSNRIERPPRLRLKARPYGRHTTKWTLAC